MQPRILLNTMFQTTDTNYSELTLESELIFSPLMLKEGVFATQV